MQTETVLTARAPIGVGRELADADLDAVIDGLIVEMDAGPATPIASRATTGPENGLAGVAGQRAPGIGA